MSKKKAAIFTRVKNGHELFKVWYKYYCKYFSEEDIYILDLGSTDGSTSNLGCNVIPLSYWNVERWRVGGLDADITCDISNKFKTELLKKYQYVVHADYDELIYHPIGLDKYLSQLEADAVTCRGHEIIHLPDKEPPIDFTKPILSQRKYWLNWNMYDKPAITSIDLTWANGFHHANCQPAFGDQLILFHLHKVDFNLIKSLNITNIVRYLIDNNRYRGVSISDEGLLLKIKELNKSAFIKDPIRLYKLPNTGVEFLHISPDEIVLYYGSSDCVHCRYGPCLFKDKSHEGHQNLFLEQQLSDWWRDFSENKMLLTTIPENIKEEQPF